MGVGLAGFGSNPRLRLRPSSSSYPLLPKPYPMLSMVSYACGVLCSYPVLPGSTTNVLPNLLPAIQGFRRKGRPEEV